MKLGKLWNFLICVGFVALLAGFHFLMIFTVDKVDEISPMYLIPLAALIAIGLELIMIYRSNISEMSPFVIIIPAVVGIGAAAWLLTGGFNFKLDEPYTYHIAFSLAPTAGILGAYHLICTLGIIEDKKDDYGWLINLVIPVALTILSLGLFTLLTIKDSRDENWGLNSAVLMSLCIGGGALLLPAAGFGLVALLGGPSSSGSRSSGSSSSGSGKRFKENDIWHMVYGKTGYCYGCSATISDVSVSGRSGSGQLYHSSFNISTTIEVKVNTRSYQTASKMEDDVKRAAQAALNNAERALQSAGVGYDISCRIRVSE